jgi:hypothetical protein
MFTTSRYIALLRGSESLKWFSQGIGIISLFLIRL